MDYDQATKTAEKLLRIGTLSYKQISYASGIPLWSIREIQSEMNMERRRLLHVLRKTMLEIGGGIHGAAINEEKLHDQFMSFVETSQALIYGRAITEVSMTTSGSSSAILTVQTWMNSWQISYAARKIPRLKS